MAGNASESLIPVEAAVQFSSNFFTQCVEKDEVRIF